MIKLILTFFRSEYGGDKLRIFLRRIKIFGRVASDWGFYFILIRINNKGFRWRVPRWGIRLPTIRLSGLCYWSLIVDEWNRFWLFMLRLLRRKRQVKPILTHYCLAEILSMFGVSTRVLLVLRFNYWHIFHGKNVISLLPTSLE